MRITDWSSDVCSSDLFIGVEPRHVLDQRGFDGIGIVARFEDRAWQWSVVDALGQSDAIGGPATRPCDDLERAGSAIGAHSQRLEEAARAPGRQYTGHVARPSPGTHCGFSEREHFLLANIEVY